MVEDILNLYEHNALNQENIFSQRLRREMGSEVEKVFDKIPVRR